MTYEREAYGGRARRSEPESLRSEVEEEPSDLDKPEVDAFEDLEDDEDLAVAGVEIDDEGDDDEEEAASPLAEDAPQPKRSKREIDALDPRDRAAYMKASALELEQDEDTESAAVVLEEDELDDSPGVRTSGGSDVAMMSQSDRRREFPSSRAGSAKRRAKPARRPRRVKTARA